MGKLDGKSVIVTGASRGIGAEIARVFASEGGRVVCAARTLKEGEHQFEGSLESTVAAIKERRRRGDGSRREHLGAGGLPEARAGGARRLRPDRRAREQRGADVLRAGEGLSAEPLDALVGGELPRAVHPQPARAGGDDLAKERAASSTSPPARRSGPGAAPMGTTRAGSAAAPATARRRPRSSASRRDWRRRCTSTASRSRASRRRRSCRRRARCTTASCAGSTTRPARTRN